MVCLHDPTTARTAPHQARTDVRTAQLKDLEQFDVGLWKSEKYRNTRIPTLSKILRELPANVILYVEIKQDDPRIIDAMFKSAKENKVPLKQLTLISFSEDIVKHAKQQAPQLTAYLIHRLDHYLTDGPVHSYLERIINTAKEIGADGLDLKNSPLIERWFVDKLREARLEFHIWTVNSAEDAIRYMNLGVDSITTDRPQGLREDIINLR
ncbi:MAG: glycerophosphoryl diester phosphodiesterase [Desulforhopalus sp.]|jgi:glycerophosphoryl diester phosphodiesterase